MSDLSLISEDDLWEELKRRNNAAILITLKEYDGRREGAAVSYCGGKFTCIGLAEHCINKIIEETMMGDDLGGES